MDSNKYRYCFIDSSYLIRRNGWACSRGKQPGEYNSNDIVRMSIQTINKIARDYGITADKYLLVFDSWSREYQGYYKNTIIGTYKTDRKFETVEELKRMEQDPNVSKEELEKYANKLYENVQRNEAKKTMKTLGKIGIPAIWTESFEFDDLAYMFGVFMSNEDKPSVIVTKDSDLMYCTTQMLDYFSLPTGGSKPVTITYQDMWSTVPEDLKQLLVDNSKNDFGSPLYFYGALINSLGESHNNLSVTKKPTVGRNEAIKRMLSNNDFSVLTDKDLFFKQLDTFKVFNFPKAIDAYQTICGIKTIGHYASLDDFHNFCNSIGLSGISDSYYQGFLSRLDQKLFSE